MTDIASLAAYRRCCDALSVAWPSFLAKRECEERLAQQRRFGTASEKVAESILEDLFTSTLDKATSDELTRKEDRDDENDELETDRRSVVRRRQTNEAT
jgi:hypothetical protein